MNVFTKDLYNLHPKVTHFANWTQFEKCVNLRWKLDESWVKTFIIKGWDLLKNKMEQILI